MRIAALDIGTNTVLLLIVASESAGQFAVVSDVHSIARLGEGVDKARSISQDALERFRVVMSSHAEVIREAEVDRIGAVATSAMRDAKNREEIIGEIRKSFGIEIELLSGDDEAMWTYRGALVGLAGLDYSQPIGTIDIGGGSTELSLGDGENTTFGKSIDIGAVRLTERLRAMQLPKQDAIRAIREEIVTLLDPLKDRMMGIQQLVAVAGTPTSLVSIHLRLKEFSVTAINGQKLRSDEIRAMFEEMLVTPHEEIVRRYPSVNPARADILPMGTLILLTVLEVCDIPEIIVSTRGLRYGIAIRELERAYGSAPIDWAITDE